MFLFDQQWCADSKSKSNSFNLKNVFATLFVHLFMYLSMYLRMLLSISKF